MTSLLRNFPREPKIFEIQTKRLNKNYNVKKTALNINQKRNANITETRRLSKHFIQRPFRNQRY